MRKILLYSLILWVVLWGGNILIKLAINEHCEQCGKLIISETYKFENRDEKFCSSYCAEKWEFEQRWYKSLKGEVYK